MATAGTLKQIWRYPVKSTRGETVDSTGITSTGIAGDRGWAIRDDSVGEIRGGRNLPNLLHCSSRYLEEPITNPLPAPMITMPDGTEILSDDPDTSRLMSELVGKPVSIWPQVSQYNLDHYRRIPMTEEELIEIFGREPGEPIPEFSSFPKVVEEFVSPPGTYFDATEIQVLTTSTLAYMKQKNPNADWSVLRFRPNMVIDTGDEPTLIESTWQGKLIKIGDVEMECFGPTPRCAMTMHPQQEDIEKDPSVLRTIVKEGNQNLGAYFHVTNPGIIIQGASVELLDK